MPRWSLKHTCIVFIAAIGLVGCPSGAPDPEPVANFSAAPRSGNTGLVVAFNDLSTPGAGGSILSWRWDFGDGGQSTSPNPSHTYLTPGSYDVALTVTSSGGSHTRTRTGYIQISSPAGSISLDETGGTATSNGVSITAAAGALPGDVSFGITRVNQEIQFNVFETINRVGDTFRITHDSDSEDVAGSTADAPIQPLTLAIPYAEDVVPTGSRIPAKVQIIAQLESGLVVPIVGEIRTGVVVASVTTLPASALYTVVYRPDAFIEVVSGDPAKVATSTNWNNDWQLSLSPVLLRQLTALRLGSVQRPSSFGNRQFTETQLSDTVDALAAGIAALQGDMEGVRSRAPRLVSLNGAYTIAFYNAVSTYPTTIGSISNVFYSGSPFGSIVVDPAQLLAVSTWNADRVAANPNNVDVAFKLSANRALSEVIVRAVVEGYDYPELAVASPADNAAVAVTAGMTEGLALYLGQMYGGMDASRAQLEGDYTVLTTPLLAPVDAEVEHYAGSSQEFFRYANNRYAPENPLTYIAGGTGAVKGILEEVRLALAAANGLSVEAASRLIATALDNAFFAHMDVSVGVAYREFALDLAFEHGQPSLLRPSDAIRLPLVLDEERFAPGSIETAILDGPDGGADFEESLANIPPLTSRAVIISADPEADSLTLTFNRSDWVVDARNQSVYVVVYREGLPGTVLAENAASLTFTDFEADLGKDTADFIVLVVNQSVSTFNSVEIAADSNVDAEEN